MTLVAADAIGVAPTAKDLTLLESDLQAAVRRLGRAAIAFSGGVDSALVLDVAYEVLGANAVALTAVSPSLAQRERESCRAVAAAIGARHILLETDEVADQRYAANTPSRCYWCKDVVYAALTAYAFDNNLGPLLDGMNRDDTADHRPGRRAAVEQGVISPLFDAGLRKADVRALAQRRGLAVWNKPAMACLSSRVPYGQPVTAAKLARIEAAEEVLAVMGFSQIRVRDHDTVARIEVGRDELEAVLARRAAIVEGIKGAGYQHVALDLTGYSAGSLNVGLRPGS